MSDDDEGPKAGELFSGSAVGYCWPFLPAIRAATASGLPLASAIPRKKRASVPGLPVEPTDVNVTVALLDDIDRLIRGIATLRKQSKKSS